MGSPEWEFCAGFGALLNPRDSSGRLIYLASDGASCYVELPFPPESVGVIGIAPPRQTVECPPAMDEAAFDDCRSGALSNLLKHDRNNDNCFCACVWCEPGGVPTPARCPKVAKPTPIVLDLPAGFVGLVDFLGSYRSGLLPRTDNSGRLHIVVKANGEATVPEYPVCCAEPSGAYPDGSILPYASVADCRTGAASSTAVFFLPRFMGLKFLVGQCADLERELGPRATH
jgi:hypothetical protein